LVVDCEGGDLLDQLEEIDGAVEERRGELALEVNIWIATGIMLVKRISD